MWKAALLLCVLLNASVAFAGAKEDADAAIARGLVHRRSGADAAALEEFQRARTMFPSSRAAAQIGFALQALGRWADAADELQAGLRDQSDPWIAKNRETLERSLAVITAHLGALEVLGLPAGAEVYVERRKVGVLPLPGPVWASLGTVAVEVRAPGYFPATRNVPISKERVSRETIELTPQSGGVVGAGGVVGLPAPPANVTPSVKPSIAGAEAPPAVPAPRAERASSDEPEAPDWHARAAWIVGASGVLLLAGGVAALVVRGDKASELARHTDAEKTCARMGDGFSGPAAQDCVNLATARDAWTWASVGAFAAAGAAAATALALVAWRPERSNKRTARAEFAPLVTAEVRPGSTLASLRWRF
jgi:hypothetical protein